jgi:hypothetical protein
MWFPITRSSYSNLSTYQGDSLLQVGNIPEDYRSVLAIILFTRKGKEHKHKYAGIEQTDETPPQAT